MKDVTVVIGAGSIGQAIARRISANRRVVLADAGFDVPTATVDVSSPR